MSKDELKTAFRNQRSTHVLNDFVLLSWNFV